MFLFFRLVSLCVWRDQSFCCGQSFVKTQGILQKKAKSCDSVLGWTIVLMWLKNIGLHLLLVSQSVCFKSFLGEVLDWPKMEISAREQTLFCQLFPLPCCYLFCWMDEYSTQRQTSMFLEGRVAIRGQFLRHFFYHIALLLPAHHHSHKARL